MSIISRTSHWFYNHFINPDNDLKIQKCKTYGDIFKIGHFGIEPNGQIGILILNDYFGIDTNKTLLIDVQQKINILYGIYEGLIKIKWCNEYLLDKCLQYNKLDELIITKYKHHNNSQYYRDFILYKIFIGSTKNYNKFNNQYDLIDDNNNILHKNFTILDDDHCPSCNRNGFITKKNSLQNTNFVPDCSKCFTPLCINCAYDENNDEEPWSKVCLYCLENKSTNNILYNIKHKINSHLYYDQKRFNIKGDIDCEFILQLLKKQNNSCYICKEGLLLLNWKPYCCYQFSIDRIKDTDPHNKNNVLISCYYCNCRHHYKFKQHNKVCGQGCHLEKKYLLDKTQIHIDEILNFIK
jgi:hypothetical protein